MVEAPVAMDATRLVAEGFKAADEAREFAGWPYTLAWMHDLDDGRRVVVVRMLWDNARLCVGPQGEHVYDDGYCYDGTARAIAAAAKWCAAGAAGEPDDWKKNLQTGEYRGNE